VLVVLMAMTIAAISATPSFAAKGGGGNPVSGAYAGSFSLVLLNSTDGLPHFGQNVTFDVSSTGAYPSVTLTCYQNGVWVTNQTVGPYPAYPWTQAFTLSSWKWTAGAADCDAVL